MVAVSIKSTAIAAALLAATTEAHNKMTLPLPTWPEGVYNQNSPSGTIDPAKVLPVPSGMSYSTDPASNTEAYWTAFNSSKYKSLKELAWDSQTLASGASNECGFSVVDGTARALPDKVQWDFFTASHQGPCEVWCDDTLVFENWNCAVDYPETPASLPYDKAKCTGKSVLTSYWIALHSTPWQVYTNCAPLSGGSSSSKSSTTTTTSSSSGTSTTTSSSSGTSTTPTAPSTTTKTKTSAPATATPSVTSASQTTTTSTEASGGDGTTEESASTDVDADETDAPATPTAPTTASKCSVRRRRRD